MRSLQYFAITASLRACCFLLALMPACRLAGQTLRTDVVVDVTPAGNAVARPTPGHPSYYLLVSGGYKELGGVVRRAVAPPTPEEAEEVDGFFVHSIAAQGYLRATRVHPPSIILTYTWGVIVPIFVRRGRARTVANTEDMLSMVAGDRANIDELNHPPPWMQEVLTDERRMERYLMVSAFDYAAWTKKRQVLFWRAHVTVPGRDAKNVVATLIQAGAPAFGAQTARPTFSVTPFVPRGEVDLGILSEK